MRALLVFGLILTTACDPTTPSGPSTPPEPEDPDAETLCLQTGGAWEADGCECAQDGATLYHVFDTTEGCVQGDMEAIEALCWSTGGAWENAACECAQDGASLNHVFDVEVGCHAPDAD